MRSGRVQPWLRGATFDLSFILLPSLLSVAVAFLFAHAIGWTSGVSLGAWLILIVGVDVSHVYSTLFRTYFNANERAENRALLVLIPLGVWLLGVALYSASALLFWQVLTYVAIFHFARQQYGFLRLYTRGDSDSRWDRLIAAASIYLATLYPVLYWHSHQPREFHWFIEGDLMTGLPVWVSSVVGGVACVVYVVYAVNELRNVRRTGFLNVPKNVLLIGTMLSWYVGIVHFNGDLIFTLTNVVSHGVPYLALVWLYGERQKNAKHSPPIFGKISYAWFFSKPALPLYVGLLLVLAFLEEGLWAGFVWREHLEAFGVFARLPEITSRDTLSWLVPLLTLPQATHYVLDGFIWKLKDTDANWQQVLFARNRSAG